MATVTGSFTGTGNSAAITPEIAVDRGCASFNVSVWGTFAGTVQPQRSFDSGATWLPFTKDRTAISATAPFSEGFAEAEAGVQWRLSCTAFTSGTINYRISQ